MKRSRSSSETMPSGFSAIAAPSAARAARPSQTAACAACAPLCSQPAGARRLRSVAMPSLLWWLIDEHLYPGTRVCSATPQASNPLPTRRASLLAPAARSLADLLAVCARHRFHPELDPLVTLGADLCSITGTPLTGSSFMLVTFSFLILSTYTRYTDSIVTA